MSDAVETNIPHSTMLAPVRFPGWTYVRKNWACWPEGSFRTKLRNFVWTKMGGFWEI